MRAGRDWQTLPPAGEDYFADMDRGMSRHPERVAAALPFLPADQAMDLFVKGRNNWLVWSGGNDRLWDYLGNNSFGALDFLKTVSSHKSLGYGRGQGEDGRWRYLGLAERALLRSSHGP